MTEIERNRTNEIEMYKGWIDEHHIKLMQLAIQNGYSIEMSQRLVEKTFIHFFESKNQAVWTLYRFAIDEVLSRQSDGQLTDQLFSFEEDAALHSKIMNVNVDRRIPFILHQFHGLEIDKIAELLNKESTEVTNLIEMVKQELIDGTDEQLAKQLEFLNKSYNRLSLPFNTEELMKTIQTPSATEPVQELTKKPKRKGFVGVAILGLLILLLIAVSFTNIEEWGTLSDVKFVEKMKKDFDKEKSKRIKTLGITEEMYNSLYMIDFANQQFADLMRNLERRVQREEPFHHEIEMASYQDIVKHLKLPSELVKELNKNPLTKEIKESFNFIQVYLESVTGLHYSLAEHFNSELEQFKYSNGIEQIDDQTILDNLGYFSDNPRLAINALHSQKIPLTDIYHENRRQENQEWLDKLKESLHPAIEGMIDLYKSIPFFIGDKLIYSLDETIELIRGIENSMIAYENEGLDSGEVGFDSYIVSLLVYILEGNTMEPFRSQDGTLSEEHREAWKKLADFGEGSGVGILMTKIVSEMEETGWTSSELHAGLNDYFRFHDAYYFAKNGDLDSFGAPTIRELYFDRRASLEELREETIQLYNDFSRDHNLFVLEEVHPLLILSLFEYANEIEDPVVMWHLIDEEIREPVLEEYVLFWEQKNKVIEFEDVIAFESYLLSETETGARVPIKHENNFSTTYPIWMNLQNNIWKIETYFNFDVID